MRISKIKKYLESINVNLEFDTIVKYQFYGGKSFYNDGTYKKAIYYFNIEDDKYKLEVKITGRNCYWLYKNGKKVEIQKYTQENIVELIRNSRRK